MSFSNKTQGNFLPKDLPCKKKNVKRSSLERRKMSETELYIKKGKALKKKYVKVIQKLLFFLFLINLTCNSLFKIAAMMYLIMYAYVYIWCIFNMLYLLTYKELEEEIGLLYFIITRYLHYLWSGTVEGFWFVCLGFFYLVIKRIYLLNWYSVIWKWTWIICKFILQTLGQSLEKISKKIKYNWYAKRGNTRLVKVWRHFNLISW